MRNFLIFIPLTIIYWSVKSTLLPGAPLPDLSLIIVFYAASRGASLQGVILSFMLGYIDDTFSGSVLGSTSFSLIIVFVLVHLFSYKVHFNNTPMRAAGAFILVLVKGGATYAILLSADVSINYFTTFVPVAVTTALFAPVVMILIDRLIAMKLLSAQGDGAH